MHVSMLIVEHVPVYGRSTGVSGLIPIAEDDGDIVSHGWRWCFLPGDFATLEQLVKVLSVKTISM